mgnify:CR=1 FL=1
MKVPRIQCVCGFGCGSSLMLKMAVDDVLKKHSLEADTFTGDVGVCLANPCDAIFVSKELGERIAGRAEVPIVTIGNFLDSSEVERQTLAYMRSLE